MRTFSKTPAADEEGRNIDCPVCGGDAFIPKWTVDGAYFSKCRSCGLLLQNPQPVRTALAARYDQEYFEYEIRNQDAFFQLMKLGLDDARFFENIAPELPETRRILDVGCATGRLLRHFKDLGWDTAGAELCLESAEYGNREHGVGIVSAPLEEAEFQGDFFSAVHASHLIEHVDDPAAFAREVFRVLAPGGVFVCVTPAFDGLQARLFGESWRSLIPDHVTLFSKRTLRRLLENAGFRVERVRTWGGLAVGSAPRWIKRPMDVWAKRLGFGDVVLMVARKSDS